MGENASLPPGGADLSSVIQQRDAAAGQGAVLSVAGDAA